LAPYNRGQAELGRGRFDAAIAAYKTARPLTNRPTVIQQLGMAYFKKEDWQTAAATFREYLEAGGRKEPGLYQHLGVSFYNCQDLGSALEWVQKGLAEFPDDKTLQQLEAKYRREDKTEGKMQQSAGMYFDVKFESVPDQADRRAKIEKALDEAYNQVTRDFSFYPDKTVPVVIYSSGADFSEGSGSPGWAAAIYDGKIRIPVEAANAGEASLKRVCTHEFTHYVVDKLTRSNCPAWIQEGLAQHEEKTDKDWTAATMRRFMGNKNLRGRILSLEQLSAPFARIPDRELVNLAYAESYLVMKHLIDKYGMYKVTQLLGDLAGGSQWGDALAGRVGLDVAEFQKQWLAAQAEEFHLNW
ncbi:MAG: tetratricopeptide repeat protein, partial [Candidatus Riflebacteria bacterium]|nr:tetratricopeptide repeat protein [Candidatus Riflebacteria bacterium]